MIKQMTVTFAIIFSLGASVALAAPDDGEKSGAVDERSERLNARFDKIDKDRDGAVSRAEIEAPKARAFKRADANDDGAVDAGELIAFKEMRAKRMTDDRAKNRMARRFQRADENRDGKLSREEFLMMTPPWFRRADENRDDRVTKAELAAFIEAGPRAKKPGGAN